MGKIHNIMVKCYWKLLDVTYRWLPDALWLKIAYKARLHRKLDLKHPKAFTEKLQWLKIHDRNPLYTKLVDKYEVKSYVTEKVGSKYVIPCYGVWDYFEEINFDKLPNQFVMKCTHDSGGIVICMDKAQLDMESVKEKMNAALKLDFWRWSREWAYKDVKPRILVEKYVADESGDELKDYKFFCFNGEPQFVEVDFNRFVEHKRNVYNMNWELQNCEIKFPSDPSRKIACPLNFDEMVKVARRLSAGIPHVRIDLYNVSGHVYFGEYTFYHGGGWEEFRPMKWDYTFGDLLILPAR